jgi:NAD(P)-dependent dehydrogenase (short-subunit alcohol dehydrogenase family)
MLTKAMALDLAPYGITVNAVAPGSIEVEKKLQRASYDRKKAAKSIPLARVGFPEDVAKAVAFLASDDAAYITGQVLAIDGGMTTALPLQQRLNPEDSYGENVEYLASR